jgi:hypothetical protein
MNEKPSVLLLIGSAKQPHSNSEMLGNYLIDRLRERECDTETMHIHRCLQQENDRNRLISKINQSDVTILAAPLFVDSLPAMVIETLERVAADRCERALTKTNHFAAIINCGFPEAQHNETALWICRQFAREACFNWLGGLSMGGGEILNSQPLPTRSGMLRSIIKSLDLTAYAIAAGKPIPEEAIRQMAKPVIPRWLYTTVGDRGWKKRAKEFNADKNLNYQPFNKKPL